MMNIDHLLDHYASRQLLMANLGWGRNESRLDPTLWAPSRAGAGVSQGVKEVERYEHRSDKGASLYQPDEHLGAEQDLHGRETAWRSRFVWSLHRAGPLSWCERAGSGLRQAA